MWTRVLAVVCLLIGVALSQPVYDDSGFEQDVRMAGLLYSDKWPLANFASLPWASSEPTQQVLSSYSNEETFYAVQGASDLTLWSGAFVPPQNASNLRTFEPDSSAEYFQFTNVTAFLPTQAQSSLVAGARLYIQQQSDSSVEYIVVASPIEGVTVSACPMGAEGIDAACTLIGQAPLPIGLFGSPPSAVLSITQDAAANLWIGTDTGLYRLNKGTSSVNWIEDVIDAPIVAVAVMPAGSGQPERIFAGSEDRLWFSSVAEAVSSDLDSASFNYYWIDGLIDGIITEMAIDEVTNSLWVANDICINVLHQNRTWQRVAGPQGLALTNLTTIAFDRHSNSMWAGSWWGATRYKHAKITPGIDSSGSLSGTVITNEWNLYHGSRWLAGPSYSEGTNVSSVATARIQGASIGVIATDYGISIISTQNVTLKEKADWMQSTIYPRHDMYGLTASCDLAEYGDLSSWYAVSNDNDGLWTSMYLASQSFRYAVTGDPDAKAAAWRAFQGLSLLNYVTGVAGLPARSALHMANPPDGTGGTWYNSTTMPGWIWKADTSSDEIVGHQLAYPLFHDLVCETDQERAMPLKLQTDMTTYIVENGFVLVDVTGEPTTWGIWAPEYLNGNRTWYSERGLNSMQMLTWLLSAYRLTADDYYLDAYTLLVDDYGYAENVINQKITDPADVNFSDDELAFLPYLLYFYTMGQGLPSGSPDYLSEEMTLSVVRAWNLLNQEHPDLWNFIYSMNPFVSASGLGNDPYKLKDSVQTLQEWPLSQISWPLSNQFRRDMLYQRQLSRSSTLQSNKLMSYAENSVLEWNANPYEINASGSGTSENASFPWLLPYWLGRYLGQISAPSSQ